MSVKSPISKKVKFSGLSKKGCGLIGDLKESSLKDSCANYLAKLQKEPGSEEHLVRLIKCLQADPNIDNDLLTLQSSIILELSQIPLGLEYVDKYCDFLYQNIYKPWVLATKDHIDAYIKRFESLVDHKKDVLLGIKEDTVYKDLPDEKFIQGIKNLSVIFLVLEYADQLSSYGYEKQASIVDKLNQILAELSSGEFRKLAKKRDMGDKRGLPKIYKQGIEYKLGCNCLCNSMFILSFLRILAKNGRLGSKEEYNDPRLYENVNALKAEEDEAGHTFITLNLDPLDASFDSAKRFYIECTAGWSAQNPTGKPLYKLEGNEFMMVVFKMIEKFLNTSSTVLKKYEDRMFPLDSSKIYTNVVRDYLLSNPMKLNTWYRIWPKLFNEDLFAPFFQYSNEKISMTQRIIIMLEYLKRFPKVTFLYDMYKPYLARYLLGPSIAREIHNEVKFHGQLLKEFLQGWDLKERPTEFKEISGMIRAGRARWGW